MEKCQEYNQEKWGVDVYPKVNGKLLESFEYRSYNWLMFLKITLRILCREYTLEGKGKPSVLCAAV